MLGRPKKAKVVQEMGESPFVQSTGIQRPRLDQSLTETDTDEYHFWSKISSNYKDSLDRLDDVESPLRWSEEDHRSRQLRSPSVSTTYDEPIWSSNWQTVSNNAKIGHGGRPDEDHFQRPDDARQWKTANSFGPSSTTSDQHISASSLQSAVRRKKLAADKRIANAVDQGRVDDENDNAKRSNKWWAFVHGITPDLSAPGCFTLLSFLPPPILAGYCFHRRLSVCLYVDKIL